MGVIDLPDRTYSVCRQRVSSSHKRKGLPTICDSPSSMLADATLRDIHFHTYINIELKQYETTGRIFSAVVRTTRGQDGSPQRTGLFAKDEGGAGAYRMGSAGRGGLKFSPFFSPSSIS